MRKNCAVCNTSFEVERGRGKGHRKYCSPVCSKSAQVARSKARTYLTCPCGKPANRVTFNLCEACYMRLRRKGTTAKWERKGWYQAEGGYVVLTTHKHHPLANKNGYVYAHRKALYDHIGPGPHDCYWCGKTLPCWKSVTVDHKNADKSDNSLTNLVPTCNLCNLFRGRTIPYLKRLLPARFEEVIALMRDYYSHA